MVEVDFRTIGFVAWNLTAMEEAGLGVRVRLFGCGVTVTFEAALLGAITRDFTLEAVVLLGVYGAIDLAGNFVIFARG